jgi:cytochrome P450
MHTDFSIQYCHGKLFFLRDFYFVTEIREIDIVAQVLVFFFAGFETSSSTLTFALMEMARSPLVQQKARENIEQVLERHDGQMSYQALQEMTYLDWILQGI